MLAIFVSCGPEAREKSPLYFMVSEECVLKPRHLRSLIHVFNLDLLTKSYLLSQWAIFEILIDGLKRMFGKES
jgi:hypothetical protein